MEVLRRVVSSTRRWWRRRHRLRKWWDVGYREMGPYRVTQNRGRSEAENEAIFERRAEFHRRLLERLRKPGRSRLLDAACGNGLLTLVALGIGFQATAFDFSAEAVDRARGRLGSRSDVTVMRGSIQSFRAHERFDVVRCAEGLCCILDDRQHWRAFRNLVRHLAEGGVLVVEEHLVPASRMTPHAGPHDMVRLRSREVYESLARETGLRLVEHLHPTLEDSPESFDYLVFEGDSRTRSGRRLMARLRRRGPG